MRGSARPAIERLACREELVADAAAVIVLLRHTGFDMGARRDDVGVTAAIAARRIHRSAAGEADDVVSAVGSGVGNAAAVGAGLANVFARADADDVLGSRR